MTKQRDLILDLLRARGSEGVHSFELRGGAAGVLVANPSQRITELEDRGHVIEHSPKVRFRGTAKGIRYTLLQDADGPAVASIVEGDDGQLQIGEAA